jgi:MFS family permease
MSTPETAAEALAEELPPAIQESNSPPGSLYADPAFWGMTITQFLGAFNDNLFKQLVLLLSIAAAAASADPAGTGATVANASAAAANASAPAAEVSDNQGLAMFLFAAPFLAFTGYAGFLSDKFSKRNIVVLCKLAEIGVMALGAVAFYRYGQDHSMWHLYAVLFLMATHSAFFGPAKYGILPEMLPDVHLPRANGFMLMTTFLAIIFGTAVAGVLLDKFPGQLWIGSAACVGIAVFGTIASLLVRRTPPANPGLKFSLEALAVPKDMVQLLKSDRPLLMSLLVSSVFWLLAGMVPSAVNSLGKIVLAVGDERTSYMSAMIGVGIAVGCAIGGIVSKGKIDFRLLRIGSIGLLVGLAFVAIPAHGDVQKLIGADGELTRTPGIGESTQWLGYMASMPTMLVLGAFTGLFAVPLQVFMQARPPKEKKGRMIAVMNQANWVGIIIASGLYWALTKLIEWQDWPRSIMFLFIALLMLPIALFYHPKNEALSED